MSKKVTGIMAVAVFLATIAGGAILDQPAYICEDTQQICIGRLSSTNKTCYYMENEIERGKRCLIEPYWQLYKNEELESKEKETVRTSGNNKEWECKVEKGRITPYTKCYSDSKEAYLGELI